MTMKRTPSNRRSWGRRVLDYLLGGGPVPRRAAFRPGVELLEDRCLPTVYLVNTIADTVAADGKLSLREALQAANTNAAVFEAAAGQGGGVVDRITFALPAGSTITLGGTEL